MPRLWPGRTVAVLASGPSMSAEVAAQVRAAGVSAVVVNSTFRLAPWADVLYAADAIWWLENRDALEFAGLKVSVQSPTREAPRDVLTLRNAGKHGFAADPDSLCTGSTSGYQAVHVAAHGGASRILLCGFDYRGSGHWHEDHPAPLTNTPPEVWPEWAGRFEWLVLPLRQRGVEVINCTPGSAITCFPRMDLEEALAAIPQPAAA